MNQYLLNYKELNESLRYSKGINQKIVIKIQKQIGESLIPLLRLKEDSFAFIGSAGKKKLNEDLSYNINIALDLNCLMKENNLKLDEVNKFVIGELKRLNLSCTENNGKLFINWKTKNESIEVRLQLVENLEWIKFSKYSPNLKNNESEYIGKYREAIFTAVSKVSRKEVISYFDSNESVKEYESYLFDADEGLCIITKSFEGKNGILKYPRLLESSKRILTDNPVEFTKILFGESFEPADVMTLEGCIETIKSRKFKLAKRRPEIYKKAKQEIINLQLEKIPEGLM